MFRYLIAFLLFFLVSTSSNAAPGCVNAAKNIIYTNTHPSGYWRSNSGVNASAGCFYYTSGTVCSIGSVGANNGLLGDTSNPLECPIDDYIGIMMILFTGLGYFVLRKNGLEQSIA